MKKDLFIEYLKNELTAKKNILTANELSEADKTAVENAVASLEDILKRVEESEDTEGVEALRESVNEISSKLTAVEEKINQSKQTIETNEMDKEFLNSTNAVHAFAEAIRNSRSADEFRANWNAKLAENGITITEGSEDAFVPEAVKGMISDVWDRNADWLKSLRNTGAKKFYCRYNTSDQTAETSRAKGWKKGETKVGQTINVAAKLLEAQFIYKIQEIDLKTKFDSDEALISYVIGELVDQILYEIKRAILVGDGRADDSDYKISSFEAVCKDSSDDWTTVSTATENGFLVDDFRAMVDSVRNDNGKEIFVFMSKASLRTLSRVQASETSTPVYIPTEQVAEQLGAARIITTDLLGSDYLGCAITPDEYYLVGENVLNPVLYTWHEGYKNLDVYRYECVAGGGINAKLSTAVLKANA